MTGVMHILANTITTLIQENATWKHLPYQSHPQTGKLGGWSSLQTLRDSHQLAVTGQLESSWHPLWL